MGQSLVHIPVHIVFSTRYRLPSLSDRQKRSEIHRYLFGICRNIGSPALRINGPADHVHILCSLGKQQCICDLVREIKSCSSKSFRAKSDDTKDFQWQKGYGAFAVSPTSVTKVMRYIENQEIHHRRISFKDEFRNICNEAGQSIDERYVWD